MKYLAPKGLARRLAEAVGLLLTTAYASHVIYAWLRPLIPTMIVLAVLAGMYTMLFGRRQ